MGPLARLLATEHEVTLVHPVGAAEIGAAGEEVREIVAEPSAQLGGSFGGGEDHLRSAAVLEAIAEAYGDDGPHYLEAADRRAPGLVSIQARGARHRALRETRIGIRLIGSGELTALHDGSLADPGMKTMCDLERAQLRSADRLLWPGGDGLDLYRRYYGGTLPDGARIPVPLDLPEGPPAASARDPGGPLRILYWGPVSRGKGVGDLAEACLRSRHDEWRLTVVGPDTTTAPLMQSMSGSIEEMFGGDPRLAIREAFPRGGMQRLIDEHDVLVAPSRFDLWPVEVLRAMASGLPVLAAPVGGLAEMVEPDVTGWLLDEVGPAAVGRGLARLFEQRDEVERIRESRAPLRRARDLVDPDRVLDAYEELLHGLDRPRPPAAPLRSRPQPLVTAVVPYFRAAADVEEAIDSLFAQTHRNVSAMIVNDGSFEPEDEILGRLAERDAVRVVTQLNGGEAAARNLGALLAEGEYLLMLDADNVADPEFVSRALEVFELEPEVGYVSCWLRFSGPDGAPVSKPFSGYVPLGNWVLRDEDMNLDGDTFALFDRRLFAERGYRYETRASTHADWELYRRLREDGIFGRVIPEPLCAYRVRPESLMRAFNSDLERHVAEEARGRRIASRTRWTVVS
jgi:glycogen synthase